MGRKPRSLVKGKGEKIVVGMSGGIDSSIALIILKKNGWNPIGVSLKFSVWENKDNKRENSCCTNTSIQRAKEICDKYECEHHVLDITKEFQSNVIDYFIDSLKKSLTPNPCMICNRNTKFFHLFKFADSMGIKYVCTGHYARIIKDKSSGSLFVSVPKDIQKDQTYYLSLLPQEWLDRIVFPLGEVVKGRVYRIAQKEDLGFYEDIPQSQDFCFVSEKSMDKFIEEEVGSNSGDIIDNKGKKIGKHRGLQYYTIGQRKKIGLSGGPYYVIEKDSNKNVLIVSTEQSDLGKTEIFLRDVFLADKKLYGKKLNVKAKIRYQHKMAKAQINPDKKDRTTCKVVFEKPQIAITPGQYCVFYVKKMCVGSGVIV